MTDTAAETITDVEVLPPEQAVAILTDEAKAEAFYAKVSSEVLAHVPDLTTAAGRKAVGSVAHKVARTKAAIDKARLAKTKEWRDLTAAANAGAGKLIDRFEALQKEVRQPLTDWEAAEKAKADNAQAVLERIKEAAIVRVDDTADGVTARLVEIEGLEIDETFGDYEAIAKAAREQAITALTAGAERLAAQEEQAAELARLRKVQEDRDAADAAAAEAQAEKDRAAEQERQAEADRAARISRLFEAIPARKADALIAISRRDWPSATRELAHLEAVAALSDSAEQFGDRFDEIATLRDAAIAEIKAATTAEEAKVAEENEAAAKKRADDAAAAATAAAAQKAKDDAAAEAAAAEKREANRRHASKVLREAKEAIMAAGGVEDAVAVKIVQAIREAKVPRVAITF